jgi:hypothetical protein
VKAGKRKTPNTFSGLMAGGQGFEPRLTVPETAVLPLDEPPPAKGILSLIEGLVKSILPRDHSPGGADPLKQTDPGQSMLKFGIVAIFTRFFSWI